MRVNAFGRRRRGTVTGLAPLATVTAVLNVTISTGPAGAATTAAGPTSGCLA